ncbi:helix-turn-helix transcriptional regulator [Listeria monocytogenes]|uniref:helix-turn-helix transcriptional regulator n=1 Tax=Listeria monocytogenes TaxID=1639 RepID=UPI002150A169|nr:helix-turn-helix transcriptional regulator [Listeria monocytogenes]MCR6313464.1 helix-turn-helix transcriptional regulator [Listeria monocytogenes]MCR6315379.1 helix-turn-helix transcriptional regulator [Listeria monocytogenes]MCR6319379.1 helix-turn-helix transcriptional regulator [Listeria monocytogenes]MCR6327037.1 helix-turn-helix transcriptional regulator [Listeria monocytogenes]MCR6331036.1 helix-turn-helix transcriptional regulator [Listeria monocytogenes]
MSIKLLDEFLKKHNKTRYQLSKLTGISQNTLNDYNKKELNKYSVSFLRALSMCTGISTFDVFIELAELEKSHDDLAGFKHLLDKHKLSFPAQEFELYCLIKEFESANIEVLPFTFNRFENETHTDIEKDVKKALQNAVTVLEERKEELL